MRHEFQILLVNAVLILAVYGLVYPRLPVKTVGRLAAADVVVTAVALAIAGLLFWGDDLGFALIPGVWSVHWAVYSFVTLLVLELPAFRWFCREYGIDPLRD